MKQLKLSTLTSLAGLIILACAMFIGVGSASAAHYSITYNSGLVSDMPADISDASIAENVTLPSTEPTRSGYRFNGWCTIADSSTCEGGTIYTAGSTWALNQTSPTNRLTLYATWQSTRRTTISELTYMQDFATLTTEEINTIKGNMTMGDQYQLADQRDGKVYSVSKLQDDNIWMTQNLDHDIVTTTNYYTPENTDVASNWTAGSATHAADDTSWTGTNYAIESYDPGDKCWDGTFKETTVGARPFCTQNGNHYHIGNYYNWSAAVANNDTSGYAKGGSGNNNLADTSICPAGWGLPRAGYGDDTFYDLADDLGNFNVSNPGEVFSVAPIYLVAGSRYIGSSNFRFGDSGTYWTAVSYNSGTAYALWLASKYSVYYPVSYQYYAASGRDVGNSVRCMARPLSATLDEADGGDPPCFPAGSQVLISMDGRTKTIEEIKAGDSVVSYDVFGDRYYEAEVTKLVIHDGEESATKLADMILDDGTTLTMTLDHPILTSDGFKAIKSPDYPALTEQDIVKTTNGTHSITDIRIYDVEPTVVYTLEVQDYDEEEDDNTYDTFIVDGVVVHNY
ncbi:InlB B-repeat-containing protein [Candidatus Saccharibacteria bacterium]|nr:InlB B-repeat-containing protein [Candidatus Saccharibacteria bacterium]